MVATRAKKPTRARVERLHRAAVNLLDDLGEIDDHHASAISAPLIRAEQALRRWADKL